MAKCDVCGNDYERPLNISYQGRQMTFDSFECAIEALAPHLLAARRVALSTHINADGDLPGFAAAKILGLYDVDGGGAALQARLDEICAEVSRLIAEGVRFIWGYPGGAVLYIYDALYKQESIQHVLVRHEQAAVHAAQGYARSTGRPGVVLVTSGPGMSNTTTGLLDALSDSTAVICISGQVATAAIGTVVLFAGEFEQLGRHIYSGATFFRTLASAWAREAAATRARATAERTNIRIFRAGERVNRATCDRGAGRILSGQTVEAFWNSVRHAKPMTIGLNCALGAALMRPYIAELSKICDAAICVYPNAGLPNPMSDTGFDETPPITSSLLKEFAEAGYVNVAGGCCGTTPAHIKAIAEQVKSVPPRVPRACPAFS